jgi:hypothetical protein
LLGRPRFFEIKPAAPSLRRLQQPPHLALAAPQKLRRSAHRQPTPIDIPQHRETPQLPIAHAQHRHRNRPFKAIMREAVETRSYAAALSVLVRS